MHYNVVGYRETLIGKQIQCVDTVLENKKHQPHQPPNELCTTIFVKLDELLNQLTAWKKVFLKFLSECVTAKDVKIPSNNLTRDIEKNQEDVLALVEESSKHGCFTGPYQLQLNLHRSQGYWARYRHTKVRHQDVKTRCTRSDLRERLAKRNDYWLSIKSKVFLKIGFFKWLKSCNQ